MNNYGIYKKLCENNNYSTLAKTLTSTASTEATRKTIKRITKSDITYAHMGQLVIKDGVCYASFIQNSGTDTEYHYSKTSGVVLAKFDLNKIMSDDFNADNDVTIFPIGAMGDFCAGYKAISIYKDNSMCLVGDLIYVCFSFIAEDENSHIFSKTFDTRTCEWIDEAKVALKYKNKIYDFSDADINEIYTDKGLLPRAKGLIEMVSAWNEYNGEYYATALTIENANNGFIVKTTDFHTMELVDTIPFNDMGMAEIASYVYKDRLFVACRQDYGIPYLYLSALDLKKMRWEHAYRIPDANSRPWFCEYNNELFLINTLDEKDRKYLNFSSVRIIEGWQQPFFYEQHPVKNSVTLTDCGSYIATAKSNDEIYFVVTKDTESFGKLSLKLYDEDEVNKKLLNLFN